MVIDGLIDPTSLEAQAWSEALALAHDLNLQDLVIASDFLEVVSNINNEALPVYAPILQEIYMSRNFFSSAIFRLNVGRIISRPTQWQKELCLSRCAAMCG